MQHIVFLSNDSYVSSLDEIARNRGFGATVITTDTELNDVQGDILISFATGVIVPEKTISRFSNAYNVHPASPDFPGRDPHHFAHYAGARVYGATAHVMTPSVDAGPILFSLSEPVGQDASPSDLLEIAERLGLIAIDELLERIATNNLAADPNLSWNSEKSTRRKFEQLAQLSLFDSLEETDRRIAAVSSPGYNNAKLVIDGRNFLAMPKTEDRPSHAARKYQDWTLDGYRNLVRLAKQRFTFATYDEQPDEPHVLWRHDIDHSLHRALKLAEIEADEGVRSTYTFMLNTSFYNLFDYELQAVARKIIALGHRAGLHFYVDTCRVDRWTEDALIARMEQDKKALSSLVDAPVNVVSYHDPTAGGLIDFNADTMAGMVNCYSKRLQSDYGYCSDSNGHWRHRPIPEVLSDPAHEKLHVLTHPVWWADEPMAPRLRIEAALLEHSRWIMKEYDDHLARGGRDNIRT